MRWRRLDRDFFHLLGEGAWLRQPIALRQPFLFYLGHFPAFAWNHLGIGVLGRRPFQPEFDRLFERGIDPVGVDEYRTQEAWPGRQAVLEYRDLVRRELSASLADPGFGPREHEPVVQMVVEHELMHHETLLLTRSRSWITVQSGDWRGGRPCPNPVSALAVSAVRGVEVPRRPGRPRGLRGSLLFGWDTEFPAQLLRVPPFAIDDRRVTNADLLEFVRDGGYFEPRHWREADLAWRTRRCGPEDPLLGGATTGRPGCGACSRTCPSSSWIQLAGPGQLGRGGRLCALARAPASRRRPSGTGRLAPRPRRRATLAVG